jgi:hypothetical protein
VVVAGLLVVLGYVANGVMTGMWNPDPPPAAKPQHARQAGAVAPSSRAARPAAFRVRVTSALPVNPADLDVTVSVRNTGTEPGTPDCTINASDPSGAYHGYDEAVLKGNLAAGRSPGSATRSSSPAPGRPT